MRGEAQDTVSSLVWKWFKVAMITGLALHGPTYQSIVTDGLDGIQGAFATAFGGGATVGATVDHMAAPFYSLIEQLFTDASTGLWPKFSLLIAGTLTAVAALAMGFISMGIYLVAKVSLAILLAIGPAFIFCALFPVTQRYAESWLSAALASVFINVLIMATVSFMTSIVYTACAQILAGYSTTSIVVDTCGLLFLSLTCGYVSAPHSIDGGDVSRIDILWERGRSDRLAGDRGSTTPCPGSGTTRGQNELDGRDPDQHLRRQRPLWAEGGAPRPHNDSRRRALSTGRDGPSPAIYLIERSHLCVC